MRGACIRLSRMMPVPLRLPHNYTPVFFNTLTRQLRSMLVLTIVTSTIEWILYTISCKTPDGMHSRWV